MPSEKILEQKKAYVGELREKMQGSQAGVLVDYIGISVEQEFWGLGIGRALTQSCIDCARRAGYAQLELQVVSDNLRALALYRSAGFREYGRNPRGFRTPGVGLGGKRPVCHGALS